MRLRLTPPADVKDSSVAGDVVLYAEVVMLSFSVEEAAGGLGFQVIQVGNTDAAVTE